MLQSQLNKELKKIKSIEDIEILLVRLKDEQLIQSLDTLMNKHWEKEAARIKKQLEHVQRILNIAKGNQIKR